MKKIRLKLEHHKRLLSKEEMEKVHGGYSCCICPGGGQGVPPGVPFNPGYGRTCTDYGACGYRGNSNC